MRRMILMMLCSCLAGGASAWDWFGLAPYDEADTNRPPRLHVLLEKANDLMEQADEDSQNGEGDKALDNYRLALEELLRVERENPERAATSEFAPLRNKKATCTAAIESIRFAQVNQNQRAVTVSDTTALRMKYNRKHGIAIAPPQTNAAAQASSPDPDAAVQAPAKDWKDRLRKAYERVKAKDFAKADVLLERLLAEQPLDLHALLLRAAAQYGSGNLYAAHRTLEKANRAHPRSYLPYYNLASVTLDLGESAASAREYYELGRAVGGPVDAALEKRFKDAEAKAKKAKDNEKAEKEESVK